MHRTAEPQCIKAAGAVTSPFIIATDETSLHPKGQTRKIIRRHVMKGKNRKRTSTLNYDACLSVNRQQRNQSALLSHLLSKDPVMMQTINDFLAIMHQVMYPVACLVDVPISSRELVADLERDTIYARSFYEIAHTYLSIERSHSSSQVVGPHMQAALRTLQEQLAATNSTITDALFFTVLMLGMLSEYSNDIEAAQTHLEGLNTLIAIRGGLSSHKAYLQIKSCRLDLRVALQANRRPILIPPDTISWMPYLSHLLPALFPTSSTPLSVLCMKVAHHAHLHTIYLDLRAFAQQLNLAQQTKRKVSPQFFQDALISILYRLLHVDNHQRCNGTCETLRIAMLAIGASVILSGRDEPGSRYLWLTARMRECLHSLEQELQERQQDIAWLRVALWLEIVAGLTVLDASESAEWRVCEIAQILGLTSWAQTRLVLKEFVWIDALHDGLGSKFLDRALCRQS